MIDTDKYEGHTIEGSCYNHKLMNDADIELAADAPLLLEEVKRLRRITVDLYTYIVSDAGISLSIIEEQMDWREEGDE